MRWRTYCLRNCARFVACALLVAPALVRAQESADPARGAVGVLRGEVGVDRTAVDDRPRCARDRLVGERPRVGVPRVPVGAEREPMTPATRPDPSVASDPCEEASDGSSPGTVSGMLQQVANGLRRLLRALPFVP